MKRIVRRGDIYYAKLDPHIGSEQGGTRPVLILSNDTGNRFSPTVIVAAITSRVRKKTKLPTHYYLENVQKARKDYKRILQLKQELEFIEHNYASPLTLQELSASVSMSPKYFCRFFSEMTHQTPMDYLNRQRIEQSCYELSTTDDSITEIAYRNGFNDLSYFIRTFKKYKGITPGKYKRS